MMEKNQPATVTIEDMTENGEGIGKVDGYTLFIKDAVIGDVAEVKVTRAKKTYGYARLMKVLTPSPDRVEPLCPVAGPCGGCQLQAMSYKSQLRFKRKKVQDHLERIGGFRGIEVPPVLGMERPFAYRNKAQYPVGRNKDGEIVMGFYAGRTHTIIPVERCLLGQQVNEQVLAVVKDWMVRCKIEPYEEETGRGMVRHVLIRAAKATGQVMVCLVVNAKKLPDAAVLVEGLKSVPGVASVSYNVNRERSNVILGREVVTLWGEEYIVDAIGEVEYEISPLSFYQVNPEQTERLYGAALEFAGLTGDEVVWDLYCGIGTISLFLAKKAKMVYGVEIVPQAIENAKSNAERNGIRNVEFFVGKAEDVLPEMYEKENMHADVIVVDPPRKGCEGVLLETMIRMKPEKIVYVSCDSATLARDLRVLCDGGYEVRKVQPVDMFGMTVHVETCVLLSHKPPDSHINVKVEFGEGKGKVPLDKIAERAEAYKPKERVTYKMIKEYIEAKYGFKVHTAYIAEVKRSLGLPMYDAPNAVEELKNPRKHLIPVQVDAIKDALKHFEII